MAVVDSVFMVYCTGKSTRIPHAIRVSEERE